MIIDHLIQALDEYWDTREAEEYGAQRVLSNLSMVSEFNRCGEALCGTASSMMLKYLPHYFAKHQIDAAVLTATSATANGCFHHFNIVKARGEEAVIFDLTASQNFTRPMDAFSGKPYFIGTRQQLREIVRQAKDNTWDHLQKYFADKEFRTPWDFDLERYTNNDFRKDFYQSIKNKTVPFLVTESLYYAFEAIWGDFSRKLHGPATLSETFDASIEGVVEESTPAISNLVTSLSYHKLTRRDGPSI